MPCYNAQNTLARSIDSIVQQTYRNIELIVINDGSTDNTIEILTEYSRKYSWIKIINQDNSGKPSIARNRGIKESSGDILCFLDADDTFRNNKIAEIEKCFSLYKSCSVAFHDRDFIGDNDKTIYDSYVHWKLNKSSFNSLFNRKLETERYYASTHDLYSSLITSHILPHTSSIAVRRKSYSPTDLLFNEKFTCYEDLDLWLHWIAKGETIYIDKVLSSYFDTEGSITKNMSAMSLDSLSFYKNHYINPVKPMTLLTKIQLRKKISLEYSYIAYSNKDRHGYLYSIKIYIRCLYWYPSPKYFAYIIKCLIRPVTH